MQVKDSWSFSYLLLRAHEITSKPLHVFIERESAAIRSREKGRISKAVSVTSSQRNKHVQQHICTNTQGWSLENFGSLSSRYCLPTNKNQLPATLLPSPHPQRLLGKAWFSGQAPTTLQSLPAKHHRKSQPAIPRAAGTNYPGPAGSTQLVGGRHSRYPAWLEILHSNKDSHAARPALNVSGWWGAMGGSQRQAVSTSQEAALGLGDLPAP